MLKNLKNSTLKTGSLKLDPQNPRIPPEERSSDQRALLHVLLKREDIKELASSISKIGLLPNERLVVMSDGRHFIVLEGNRRLSAVKLLINPDLAPTPQQVRYFKSLAAKTDLSGIAKLDVVIVPDRASASPILAHLHTQTAKKRWSSLQQAAFYREMISEGLSVGEVSDTTGKSLGEIRGFLRTELLFRMATSLDLPPKVKDDIEDEKFAFTTLERFLDSTVARKFLGLEFDDVSELRGVVHPDRFKAVLRQVVIDIATIKSLTRQVHDEKGFRAYVEKTESKIPDTRKRGSFSPTDILEEEDAKGKPSPEPPKPRPKPPPKVSKSIIPNEFTCSSRHAKIQEIFDELKKMQVSKHRNSTGVMLRVILELALWEFIKDKSEADNVLDKCDPTKKRRKNNPDYIPPLRELISYVADKRILPGVSADEYKSIRTLASKDTSYIITIEGFNSIVHNPGVIPVESDLRALWLRAESLLRVILN